MASQRLRALPATAGALVAAAVVLSACGGGTTTQPEPPDPAPTPTQAAPTVSEEPEVAQPAEPDAGNPYGLTFDSMGIPVDGFPARTGDEALDTYLGLGTQGFVITDNPSPEMPELNGPVEISADTAEFLGLPLDAAQDFPSAQINVQPGEMFLTGLFRKQATGPLGDEPVSGKTAEVLESGDVIRGAENPTEEEYLEAAKKQLVSGGAAYYIEIPSVAYLCLEASSDFDRPLEDAQCRAVVKVVVEDPAASE